MRHVFDSLVAHARGRLRPFSLWLAPRSRHVLPAARFAASVRLRHASSADKPPKRKRPLVFPPACPPGDAGDDVLKAVYLETRVMVASALEPATRQKISTTWSQYCQVCEEYCGGADPLPVTFFKLGTFAVLWCRTYKYSGLKDKIYHVKRHVRGEDFLPATEDFLKMKDLRAGLSKFDNRKAGAKLALRLEHFLRMVAFMKAEGTWDSLGDDLERCTVWTQALVQHQGMLRTAELISPLRVKHLHLVGRMARLEIHKSKMNKGGPPEIVVFGGVPEGACTDVCPLHWLRTLLRLRGLAVDRPEDAEEVLFARQFTTDGVTRPASKPWTRFLWVAALRGLVKLGTGVDPSYVAGHSPRAGGATDALHSGAPPHLVMLQGRWKSYSSVLLYDRWSDEERAKFACDWVARTSKLLQAGSSLDLGGGA